MSELPVTSFEVVASFLVVLITVEVGNVDKEQLVLVAAVDIDGELKVLVVVVQIVDIVEVGRELVVGVLHNVITGMVQLEAVVVEEVEGLISPGR